MNQLELKKNEINCYLTENCQFQQRSLDRKINKSVQPEICLDLWTPRCLTFLRLRKKDKRFLYFSGESGCSCNFYEFPQWLDRVNNTRKL